MSRRWGAGRAVGAGHGRARGRAPLAVVLGLLLTACGAATAEAPTAPPEPTASVTPAPTLPVPPPTSTAVPTVQPGLNAATAPELVRLATIAAHDTAVSALAYSPDGAWLASGALDGSLRLWPGGGGAAVRRLEGHTDAVWGLAFSPDGARLISGSDDRTVRVWELPAGRSVDVIRSASLGRVLRVAYSPDGLWIAAADQFCLVQVRSARTGVLYRSLMQPGCRAAGGNIVETWGLAFTPDSARLLTAESQSCCGGTVQAWELEGYAAPVRVPGLNRGVRSMALTPDGQLLAVALASSAQPRIVRADSGEVLQELSGHAYAVRDLAISPDGQLLATASADRTVRVWDLHNGDLLTTLEGHQAPVNGVVFSADGSRLASGDEAGVILIWGVE